MRRNTRNNSGTRVTAADSGPKFCYVPKQQRNMIRYHPYNSLQKGLSLAWLPEGQIIDPLFTPYMLLQVFHCLCISSNMFRSSLHPTGCAAQSDLLFRLLLKNTVCWVHSPVYPSFWTSRQRAHQSNFKADVQQVAVKSKSWCLLLILLETVTHKRNYSKFYGGPW